MLDNELIKLIRDTIIEIEATAGINGTPIKQAFQPTQQGVNTEPTAYIYKIGDRRYGWPQRKDVWDDTKNVMTHTEMQQYETTFQISALATQDPKNPSQYTASDTLNRIAYILQSDECINAFQARGVGIERVMDIRNPYFTDDRQRFEANPSFDFILTHKQAISNQIGFVKDKEFKVITV